MIRTLLALFAFLFVLALGGGGAVIYVFYTYGKGLPDYTQLADYEPPVMTRVHAGDGRLLAEYAREKRVFVPIGAMPKKVLRAFLSAEDKGFYKHPGVDFSSVVRAVLTNIKNLGSNRRPVGASTITQQVAKNFLLTNEVSLARKIKEAILSFRIERAFSKDRILELYMNEIYLGFGSYGVAAAALNYFDKSLDDLTLAEMAYLGALPKAPNNYHPIRKKAAAVGRRNWVIGRMLEDGAVSAEEAERAIASPLLVRPRVDAQYVKADYFAEEVRRELAARYGENELYEGGLSVRTTLDPRLQNIARTTLRSGLIAYDRRHGWRGPLTNIDLETEPGTTWAAAIKNPTIANLLPADIPNWRLAIVLELSKGHAEIGFSDETEGRIPQTELRWARPWIKGQTVGPRPRQPSDVLARGDVILVETVTEIAATKKVPAKPYPAGTYGLRQVPAINGGLVAIDPHTGRVLAMSGGFSYAKSQFNRAVQAARQPGSAFKPFVYLAAMDAGYTPATLILDAPFVIDQGSGLPKWRPVNYAKKFYGPSTMRLGIEKSRNLMTVRLAQTLGMERVAEYAKRFGVSDNLPPILSMSLGAGETTLLKLTTAYAMLVNGGKRIKPTVIDRIQDRTGKTVFSHDKRVCPKCQATFWVDQPIPDLPDLRAQLTDPASAYQVVSMLHGVVQRGTGRRVKAVGKPLGGKTGTTNKSLDTWFVGFAPDLAVGVFAGFDRPISLGRRETGSSVSAPIFRDFMAGALEGKPAVPFRIPPGIRLVRVNGRTGQLATPGEKGVILEAFKSGSVPTGRSEVIKGMSDSDGSAAGSGGVY